MALNLSEPEISLNDDDAAKYEEIIQQLHNSVKSLPKPNYDTVSKLIKHLKRYVIFHFRLIALILRK